MKVAIVRQHFWKVQDIGYLLLGVKKWVQDIQCVQPNIVIYHAPAVLCEQYITRTSLQIIINASVPELQAREWCMGDVHANFNSFSRFRLLRPPYPSPVPEFFCNHKKWMTGSLKHMTEIVHWISSRKMN
jgi:hypothetical protein